MIKRNTKYVRICILEYEVISDHAFEGVYSLCYNAMFVPQFCFYHVTTLSISVLSIITLN